MGLLGFGAVFWLGYRRSDYRNFRIESARVNPARLAIESTAAGTARATCALCFALWRSVAHLPHQVRPPRVAFGRMVAFSRAGVAGNPGRLPSIAGRRSPRCRIANSAHSFALRQISANPLLDRVVRFLCGICRALRQEVIFRGFIQPLLSRDLGVAAGILVTAAVFGLLHGPEYSGTWQYVVLIAFAGACFGWVRFRGRSVIPAALMHAGFNAVFFFAAVAQTSIQK